MVWFLLAMNFIASAQGLDTHKPVVPSSGIAAEDGPGAMWVNPANLSYDRDRRYGLFFSRSEYSGLSSFALTGGIEGLGLALHNLTYRDGSADWSLDSATSFALPERLSVGLLFSWNFRQDQANFVSYDAGMSWRPLPWFGLGANTQNVGTPDRSGRSQARTAFSAAFRPFQRAVVFSGDYGRVLSTDGFAEQRDGRDEVVLALRIRPTEGLYLRASADAVSQSAPSRASDDGWAFRGFGAGIEFYLDGVGAGVHQGILDDKLQTTWLGTDEPGESLVRSGRRVPVLSLLDAPPYETQRSLLIRDDRATWLETMRLIQQAEEERGVRGLVLTLGGAGFSWAQIQELRDRITALEERGRPVLVFLTGNVNSRTYYAASAASRIVMHPAGTLNLVGPRTAMSHFRGALKLLGIEPQFVRRSEYKTAPESYLRHEPSAAALEQMSALLEQRYDVLLEGLATTRDLTSEEARRRIDEGPYTAEDSLSHGLVDLVAYADELDNELETLHDGRIHVEDIHKTPESRSPWEAPAQIALIYVDGVIVDGETRRGGIIGPRASGSATVVRSLATAAESPLVRAVVIRVDSPGGSAFASDEIWHAIERLQETGKPVVVSMGGVAASGGYYISAGADAIWAEPTTITGSIGVFNGKFVTTELLENVGIRTTLLTRGRNADIDATTRRWDDMQRERMQALVDATYEQFKDRVSQGRSMESADVEELARGRVWTGDRALELGLVDELGGLVDAILDARQRANIPDARRVGIVEYTREGKLLDGIGPSFLRAMIARAAADVEPDLALLGTALEPFDAATVLLAYPDTQMWALDPRFVGPATP